MKVALAQMNATLGGFEKNYKKALKYIREARKKDCDLVIFPEAFLFGYPTYDLVEYEFTIQNQNKYVKKIEKNIPEGIAVLIGGITFSKKRGKKYVFNSALFMQKEKKTKLFHKELLPTYDVFDESRYLTRGNLKKNILRFKGQRILISICEDIWAWQDGFSSKYPKNPIKSIKSKDVDLIINLSGSPFSENKLASRMTVIKKTASYLKAPLIYVNAVGGQDELIFDGGSCITDKKGDVVYQLPRFQECFETIKLGEQITPIKLHSKKILTLEKALSLGLKDFVKKNGFKRVHLGLSGGLDSALVCCLAVKVLGASNVTAIAMPGPYSSKESLILAKQLAKNLNIQLITFDIIKAYETLNKELQASYGPFDFGVTNENLQARIRGVNLMAYSNLKKSLLLNCSNKSEIAVGYSTLYGDTCGALCPIGDLLKTQVYQLSEFQNKDKEVIPTHILTRAPSAELSHNQTDQQSLPKYDILDKSIKRLVVEKKIPKSKIDRKTFDLLIKSEFKRFQAPPILKVSERSFGQGRRYPIAYS